MQHEEEAGKERSLTMDEGSAWESVAPYLDEAVAGLNDIDRAAVLLRHFEGKSLHEVAATLAVSEAAAEKRVSFLKATLGIQWASVNHFS